MAKAQLEKLAERLRSSYWFLPGLLALAAVGLAALAGYLDTALDTARLGLLAWLNVSEAAGARAILTTIAGSMITVVSLTFSITIVALTLTASQFGPHLLYSFMRDRRSQTVLGVFVATFIYCLLILRLVEEGRAGIPHLSVALALGLALLSAALLVYFLHHIAETLQATAVVTHLGHDLKRTVRAVFPAHQEDAKQAQEAERWLTRIERDHDCGRAAGEGVLQALDAERLVAWAEQHDVVIAAGQGVGSFIIRGTTLLRAHPAGRLSRELEASLQKGFLLGTRRTLVQDVEFAFQQLVEVAVRALSPAINAPFTVAECIDGLAAGFIELLRRGEPTRLYRDQAGQVRLIVPQPSFAGLLAASFDPIRWHARDDLPVLIRLLGCYQRLGEHACTTEQIEALQTQLEQAYRSAEPLATLEADRARLERARRAALAALG